MIKNKLMIGLGFVAVSCGSGLDTMAPVVKLSCSVTQGDGGVNISCPDGSTSFLPNGAAGLAGESIVGPQGAQGLTGATGATGAAGADGAQGPQGETGAQGIQGVAGVNGTNGQDGAVGATGATGPQGVQGETGPQGPAGANGADGQDGAQGPQGVAGATGPQGPAGPQGATGAAGVSCSSASISGGFSITCGGSTSYYIIPSSSCDASLPRDFVSSVQYNLPVASTNVALPSSFDLNALTANVGSGANGRITLNVNGTSYCYQSSVGTKRFSYIGTLNPGSPNCNSGAAVTSGSAPTGINVSSMWVLFEHRSDLASRWLLSRSISVKACSNKTLSLN